MKRALPAAVAAMLIACSSSTHSVPTPAVPSPGPTLAILASPTVTASAAAATPTMPPSRTPVIDAAQAFRPLTTGWRPSGPTLIIATSNGPVGTTLVALPLPTGAGGRADAPTPIVSIGPGGWSLRPDGGSIAVDAWTGRGGGRIAVLDLRTGTARWLTPDVPGTMDTSPVWSKGGTSVYYRSSSDGDRTSGLFQIGADGSGKRQIRASDDRTGPPQALTPDGTGLVWSRGQAGGSVEILDIASGVNRHIEDVARILSWRSQQPRALLIVGGCCAGRPGGSLVAWDDMALTSRVVAAFGPNGDPAWGGGAWDPTGTRIAAVRFDAVSPYEGTLVILDPTTGAIEPIAGTQGVGSVQWIAEGILFTRHVRQPAAELMFVPSAGGAAVSLYKADGVVGFTVVRP